MLNEQDHVLGIGTVLYTDVYDVSCDDANKLGREVGLGADHYVCGELGDLIDYLGSVGVTCDMFASHDCIEHIYDIEDFLRGLRLLPGRSLGFWLSTSANPLRRKTRMTLMKVQIEFEHEDRQPQWGDKQRDTLRSFLPLREEIISSVAPDLSHKDIELLARRTRGMRRDDIMRIVSEFKRSGELPNPPAHPTNTCDPYTGNWAEHLMDPFSLRNTLRREGLAAEVLPGYWDPCPRPRWKAVMKSMTNMAISVLGKHGLRISPYYILCGTSSQSTGLSEQIVRQP